MDSKLFVHCLVAFCKQNCAVRGDRGCDSCQVGYISEPKCCNCDTIGNETHAFYKTPDGKCLRKLQFYTVNEVLIWILNYFILTIFILGPLLCILVQETVVAVFYLGFFLGGKLVGG